MSLDRLSSFRPPSYETCTGLEAYLDEIEIWDEVCTADPTKKALMVVLSLPQQGKDGEPGLRARVIDHFKGTNALKSASGMETLKTWLRSEFLKDDNTSMFQLYEQFLAIKNNKVNVEEYIQEFGSILTKLKRRKVEFPASLNAYLLLTRGNLTEVQLQCCLKDVDLDKQECYDHAIRP